jgi:hypothetical protein
MADWERSHFVTDRAGALTRKADVIPEVMTVPTFDGRIRQPGSPVDREDQWAGKHRPGEIS